MNDLIIISKQELIEEISKQCHCSESLAGTCMGDRCKYCHDFCIYYEDLVEFIEKFGEH